MGELNIINLLSKILTHSELEVLSLGLDFCPSMDLNRFDFIKDLNLFTSTLCLKVLHHKSKPANSGLKHFMSLSKSECRALKELLESEDDVFLDTPPTFEDENDLIVAI